MNLNDTPGYFVAAGLAVLLALGIAGAIVHATGIARGLRRAGSFVVRCARAAASRSEQSDGATPSA